MTNPALLFSDPFRDMASISVPHTHRRLLRWCELAWLANRDYANSVERLVSYFITKINVNSEDDEQRQQWLSLYNRTLRAPSTLRHATIDAHCYGSGFLTFVVPFQRFLRCGGKRCSHMRQLGYIAENGGFYQFQFSCPHFIAKCPTCGYKGPWLIKDEQHDVENKLALKRWSPHEIELIHNIETGHNRYLWRIPPDYRAMLRRGDCDIMHLEQCNKYVLEAVSKNMLFEFHPDTIFQVKQESLAGLPLRGWGMPHPLLNKQNLYMLQVLYRQGEAFGHDYIMPFRVISPVPRQGSQQATSVGTDPYMGKDAGKVRAFIDEMIELRTMDPAAIHSCPFPLQYQVFGADAKQLFPIEIHKFYQENLLNSAGPPIDLWRGTLQLQAAPVALRLMESTNADLVETLDACLRWIGTTSARLLTREPAESSFEKVTIADDIERTMLEINLMTAGKLAESIALRNIGVDPVQNRKLLISDQVENAREQARGQELMAEQGVAGQLIRAGAPGTQPPAGPGGAAGGQAPPAGDPAQAGQGGMSPAVAQFMGGSSAPQTMQDMMAAGTSLAQELVVKAPTERQSVLQQLRQSNEPLHRIVTGELARIRRQTNSQAGQAALAQGQAAA